MVKTDDKQWGIHYNWTKDVIPTFNVVTNLFNRDSAIEKKFFKDAKHIVWDRTKKKINSGGGNWPKLKDSTLRMRRYRGVNRSNKLLARGDLYVSVTGPNRGSYVKEGKDFLVIGTNLKRDGVPYPRLVQYGGYTANFFGAHPRVPGRPYLTINKGMKDDFRDLAKKMIKQINDGELKP